MPEPTIPTTTPETAESKAAAAEPVTSSDSTDKPLGENGEKALKAERERAATAEKAAAALQKQLDEIAAANLSDLERAQKEAADYKTAAEAATANTLRFKIAAESGITENVDLILTGGDEQTLRAQAKLWADRASDNPKPDLSQGPKGDVASSDPRQAFAAFMNS